MKQNFFAKVQFVKAGDILHLLYFICALPISWIFRIFRKDIWLICEYQKEARDNGYYLFKYLREAHRELDVVYAIDKSCDDYEKVKDLGEVIQYGSLKHWVYYLAAEVNISSQKGGKPNAAVCYLLEVYGILKNTRVFLQHGVIMNDLPYLYYKKTKLRLFICSSEKERAFVIKNFRYPPDYVVNTGLCRFDSLFNKEDITRVIFVCPTWRNWIAHPTKDSYEIEDISDFTNTKYYIFWDRFLHNSRLHKFLENNNLKLMFCPHRNMRPFLKYFTAYNPRIEITDWKSQDIHKRIIDSPMLITDYSSISMDFAYLEKPIIYYQFDREKFHLVHQPPGYFDYYMDGFGPVCHEDEELVDKLTEVFNNNMEILPRYRERIEEFFIIRDNNNCKRNYAAIKKVLSEVRRSRYGTKNRLRPYMGRRQRREVEKRKE